MDPNSLPAGVFKWKQEHTVQSCRIYKCRTCLLTHKQTFSNLITTFQYQHLTPKFPCSPRVPTNKAKIKPNTSLKHTHTHTQTHTLVPTSFPRQDLKTSIAIEFIKVVWWIVCDELSEVLLCLSCYRFLILLYLSASLTECFPVRLFCILVCASSFIKARI